MTLSDYVRNIINRVKTDYEGNNINYILDLCIYWHNVGYSYSNRWLLSVATIHHKN